MSGECEKCAEHCLDCKCTEKLANYRFDAEEGHNLCEKLNRLCWKVDAEMAFAAALTLAGMAAERLGMCPHEFADTFGVLMASYEEMLEEKDS